MTLATARLLDSLDKPAEAVQAFEASLVDAEARLSDYVATAVLYFQILDPGYAAFHHLSMMLVDTASARFRELLDAADARFGASEETAFWRAFFAERRDGATIDPAFYLQLAGPTFLWPYLPLYAWTHGVEYRTEMAALIEATDPASSPGRYVRSYLPLRSFPRGGKAADTTS